jgi:hypothetical protein
MGNDTPMATPEWIDAKHVRACGAEGETREEPFSRRRFRRVIWRSSWIPAAPAESSLGTALPNRPTSLPASPEPDWTYRTSSGSGVRLSSAEISEGSSVCSRARASHQPDLQNFNPEQDHRPLDVEPRNQGDWFRRSGRNPGCVAAPDRPRWGRSDVPARPGAESA